MVGKEGSRKLYLEAALSSLEKALAGELRQGAVDLKRIADSLQSLQDHIESYRPKVVFHSTPFAVGAAGEIPDVHLTSSCGFGV